MGWTDLFAPNWLEEKHPDVAPPDAFRGPQLSVSPEVSIPPLRSTELRAPRSSFRPIRVQEAAPTACSATARILPRRRAVLVGIDHRPVGWRLRTACLDAMRFQLVLMRYFDFCTTDFKLFVEADNDGNVVGRPPTKHNLIEGLEWLVADSQAGDILLFYFAGMSTESGVPPPIAGFPKLSTQSLVTQDLQLLSAAEFNHLLSRTGGGTQVACFFDSQFTDSFVPMPARLILDRHRPPFVERTPGGRRQPCKA
ncbi:MAG: uncharacterized protein KVP18_000765 [Porospora cf. gigantea A]|uniref:uncharacterized protein n=1 Tax=Porospora cf. gigantea A TaxID=2853593 RepID=UPI003559BBFA|nr:MAG: hypothetical protein KVP18_000765 [Porospora cf. gigantea A]